MVTEHLLAQGKYPELAMHPKNVAFVCGCINLDNYKGEERIRMIEVHFPNKFNWVKRKMAKKQKSESKRNEEQN